MNLFSYLQRQKHDTSHAFGTPPSRAKSPAVARSICEEFARKTEGGIDHDGERTLTPPTGVAIFGAAPGRRQGAATVGTRSMETGGRRSFATKVPHTRASEHERLAALVTLAQCMPRYAEATGGTSLHGLQTRHSLAGPDRFGWIDFESNGLLRLLFGVVCLGFHVVAIACQTPAPATPPHSDARTHSRMEQTPLRRETAVAMATSVSDL